MMKMMMMQYHTHPHGDNILVTGRLLLPWMNAERVQQDDF